MTFFGLPFLAATLTFLLPPGTAENPSAVFPLKPGEEPMDEVLRNAQSRFSLSFLLLVSIYILFSVLGNLCHERHCFHRILSYCRFA